MKNIGGFDVPETLDEQLGPRVSQALFNAVKAGLSADGLHVAGRWWQLETHLRTLAYIELRAAFGSDWIAALDGRAIKRAADAEALDYMASPDDLDPMAFLDTFDLFDLISTWWEELFAVDIGLKSDVWTGRAAELRPIRHRIAHCRRPHVNDADRVEQLLRDLEPGANRAYRSYVQQRDPDAARDDPVVLDWLQGRHSDAARLIDHGADNKGIRFDLSYSQRPWADVPVEGRLSGTAGVFWVMEVRLAFDDRYLVIDDYWAHEYVQASLPLIGHAICPDPNTLYLTFPATGDPELVSNAIGRCFEAVFHSSRPGPAKYPMSARQPSLAGPQLDPRLDAGALLSVLTGLWPENAVSYFGVPTRP